MTQRRGEGEEASYRNPELCDRYKSLPLASIQHGDLTQLPGFREAMVVVVGGGAFRLFTPLSSDPPPLAHFNSGSNQWSIY